MAEFYETAQKELRAAGITITRFELGETGIRSKHNLKYWRRRRIGIWAGAHSFSGTERWANGHDAARM